MNRILFVRGGAIGDFILTLPALKAMRDAHPSARIEILGYKHIAALAEKRFYAEAVRSIEYGSLSGFFAKDSELDPELRDYFGSFDLIVSYFYDPDSVFENNLRRCGVRKILRAPAKIDPPSPGYGAASKYSHAVRQLARPIQELGLTIEQFAPRIYPSAEDRQFAEEFLRDLPESIVAMHPGSGSKTKNWPIDNWIALGNDLLGLSTSRNDGFPAVDLDKRRSGDHRSLVIVSGEADETQSRKLELEWTGNSRVRFARNLSLPQLGAVLENSLFVGHDSGISHLAAAAGAKCVLLFGPTDPAVWAPLNENVQVIRAPSCRMEDVDLAMVKTAIGKV